MNREIKFRAWDKEKKEMREVTSLNFYDEYMWVEETPMTGDKLPIEGTPLMQFTGLKDKNGKEVYEGDVVTYHFQRGLSFSRMEVLGFPKKTKALFQSRHSTSLIF
jgi:uncharacterized phage protein (TIGR01671 family)